MECLVNHGPICGSTIMGKPTDMKIAIGHKGLGDSGIAHSIHEYIKIEDIKNVALVCGLTSMEYCS